MTALAAISKETDPFSLTREAAVNQAPASSPALERDSEKIMDSLGAVFEAAAEPCATLAMTAAAPSIASLWREWSMLRDESLAIELENRRSLASTAELEQRDGVIFARLDEIHALVKTLPVTSAEDFAALFDMALETDLQPTCTFDEDMASLIRLIAVFERAAPSVRIGSLARHRAYRENACATGASVAAPDVPGSLVELWREWAGLKDQQQDLDRRRAGLAAGLRTLPCIQIGNTLFSSEKEIERGVDPRLRAAAIEALRVETEKHVAEEDRRGITALDASLDKIDWRIDLLHEAARARPARSIGELAALFDMALDLDVEIDSSFYGDRLNLEHFVDELRRLAPEVEISTMRRLIACGAIEAPPI